MRRRRLDGFERRLAALHADLAGWQDDPERSAEARERRAMLAALLRAGLQRAGLDPGEAAALRRLEAPEPPPPFIHPLRRLAQRRRRSPVDTLEAMTARFHRGPPPKLSDASAMHLVGYYCFGLGRAARKTPA